MGSRRKAREAVLKVFYLSESRNISIDEAFHEMAEIDRIIASEQPAATVRQHSEGDNHSCDADPLRQSANAASDPQQHSSSAANLKPFALGLDDQQAEFAQTLAHYIVDSREQLNELIRPVLKNWDLSRISRIDRYIMWIALAEMQIMHDIPIPVSINEAIELSKKYSSEKSSSFINGVLDGVARNIGRIK